MPCTCRIIPSHADAVTESGIYFGKNLQESEQLYAATTLYRDTLIAQAANPNFNGAPPVQPEVELTDFQCAAWLTYYDWALVEHEDLFKEQANARPLNPSKSVHRWLCDNIMTANCLSLEHDQDQNACTDEDRYDIQ